MEIIRVSSEIQIQIIKITFLTNTKGRFEVVPLAPYLNLMTDGFPGKSSETLKFLGIFISIHVYVMISQKMDLRIYYIF